MSLTKPIMQRLSKYPSGDLISKTLDFLNGLAKKTALNFSAVSLRPNGAGFRKMRTITLIESNLYVSKIKCVNVVFLSRVYSSN